MQKAAQRREQNSGAVNDSANSTLSVTHAVAPSSSKPAPLRPEHQEVFEAVESLYHDELKPFGRLLRKRIVERHLANMVAEGVAIGKAPDVDVQHLRAVCEGCQQLVASPEEGGDWSVAIVGKLSNFVDIYTTADIYPQDLWEGAAAYLEHAPEEEMTLNGGRYSCAQILLSRGLPFLDGCSLGQVCHIVELAISEKKLLGYLNGAIVPYGPSLSKRKEKLAGQQLALTCPEAVLVHCSTWEEARACLCSVLDEAASDRNGSPGRVSLSNVKRLIRERCGLELSETALGHSKLSELLQDHRLDDICLVQLDQSGYTVVQRLPSEPQQQFCADEPLCLDDLTPPREVLDFGATPCPFDQTPVPTPWQYVQSAIPSVQFHGVDNSMEMPTFKTSPAQYDDRNYLGLLLHDYFNQTHSEHLEAEPPACQFCPNEPLCFDTGANELVGASDASLLDKLSAISSWKDGQLKRMIRNTFIHAVTPSLTPVRRRRRRSQSLGSLSSSTMASSAATSVVDTLEASSQEHSPRTGQHHREDIPDDLPPTPALMMPPTPWAPPLAALHPLLLPQHTAVSLLPVLRLSDHLQ
jgi:hypothetical protein